MDDARKDNFDPSESSSSSEDDLEYVRDENKDEELSKFSKIVSNFSIAELDRDLAEAKNDIEFLEFQIKVDLGSYAPEDLEAARARIDLLKRKVDILEREIANRTKKNTEI